MQSSSIVVDPRRAWLELQSDLGGDEVIFDTPLSEIFREGPKEDPAQPGTTEAEAVPRSSDRAPKPAWLVDAPAIPGPGMRITLPQLPASAVDLEGLAEEIKGCSLCPLANDRTNAVPGEGDPTAGLMVVGEGPGEQEDLSGRPFVGRAGTLLDKMLVSIDTPRPTVFIANVVKCRPPRNRAPLPDERSECMPYLHRQIALVKPRVILALGVTAAESLLGVRKPLGSLRLKVHQFGGIPLIVTYHPAALLRNPNWKRPAWDDVRIARQLLDRTD